MKTLTTCEVDNAVRTIEMIDAPNYRTYYIDELEFGWFGVSMDEYPLKKFDTLDKAKEYVGIRLNSVSSNMDLITEN